MATKETSLRSCIEEISSTNTDYKYPVQAINQAESLKSLSNDLYTDNIRFIYELIQNADDAKSINVNLSILEDKYLIIAHDGKAFDERDLQGLCGVNNGTKKKDLDKTGYKGLGFKAVFGKSDKVIIYSNEEYFRFDSSYQIKWNKQWSTDDQQTWEIENERQFIYPWQINPIWTTKDEIPSFIIDFLDSKQNQIHVATIILLNNVEEIRQAIDQLKQQPYMFLFLRNISQMTFSTKRTDIISMNRDTNYGFKKVSVNKKMISQWIIRRAELDVPDDVREKLSADTKVPEKLRLIKKVELFFAAKYKESENLITEGGIEKLHDQESVLFSYLPTKILEYKFPILINANFLTNANREQIHIDSAWNQWLFDKIGSEIFQWITELVTNENIRSQAYRLIPSTLNLTNNILSKRFDESMEIALKNSNFIINRTNQLLRIDEVIMDRTSLSEHRSFINIDSMRQYVIDNYKDNHFQCAEHPFIDFDSNLHRVGVREFTWNNCIQMFNSNIFLQTHSIEQNKQMIEYFYSKLELEINMQQIPFLMDQNNRLQLTKNIYFPVETIGISETTDSNDLFINKIIFDWLNENTQKEIKEWLQKLGVVDRTDLTYLYRTIIPNASTYITQENVLQIIKVLFNLFQENDIDKNELDQLKNLKLLTTRGTLIQAERCYFSDKYKPQLPLEDYLKINEENFLSFDYVTSDICRIENKDLAEWRRFFTMLGVQEEFCSVEFQRKLLNDLAIEYGFDQRYLCQSRNSNRGHSVGAYSGLKTIMFLEHTINNYDFSKFFWSYVFKNIEPNELIQNTTVHWGYHDMLGWTSGTSESNADYVVWFVQNIECVPTTLNTCESSSNIFVNTNKEMKELCAEYMPFSSISLPEDKSDWNRFFVYKTKLLINDYFDLLERIHHDEKNLNNNLDRIQVIYSHILDNINIWSVNELQIRVQTLYLLSENNQWKLARDLFIYMEGNGTNNNINDGIPCVKLDFKNKTHKDLNKFLELFNIKQIRINDLKFNVKQSFPAEEFQQKLNEILPYLKNWLKKLLFPIDVISSIDKIIQQEIKFIESDCLELFYNGKLIQETNVYFDTIHQQFYISRPWNSETTFIDLPNKLCELLNIQQFEGKLRYLLKGEREEIRKYFTKLSIEIPDMTLESNESCCIKDKDTNSLHPVLLLNKRKRSASANPVKSIIENIKLTKEKIEENGGGLDRYVSPNEEEMVYKYLQEKYSSQTDSISIKWENENGESHLPYDILLIDNGKKHYIEVKTTRSINRHTFSISINQTKAILEYKENYSIYLVFLEEKKLIIFNNIRRHLGERKQLTSYLVYRPSSLDQIYSLDN